MTVLTKNGEIIGFQGVSPTGRLPKPLKLSPGRYNPLLAVHDEVMLGMDTSDAELRVLAEMANLKSREGGDPLPGLQWEFSDD